MFEQSSYVQNFFQGFFSMHAQQGFFYQGFTLTYLYKWIFCIVTSIKICLPSYDCTRIQSHNLKSDLLKWSQWWCGTSSFHVLCLRVSSDQLAFSPELSGSHHNTITIKPVMGSQAIKKNSLDNDIPLALHWHNSYRHPVIRLVIWLARDSALLADNSDSKSKLMAISSGHSFVVTARGH